MHCTIVREVEVEYEVDKRKTQTPGNLVSVAVIIEACDKKSMVEPPLWPGGLGPSLPFPWQQSLKAIEDIVLHS
jgi:hypothetical protein